MFHEPFTDLLPKEHIYGWQMPYAAGEARFFMSTRDDFFVGPYDLSGRVNKATINDLINWKVKQLCAREP